MANKTVTPLDLVEILGKKTKEGISDKIAETLIVQSHAIKGIGPSPQGSEKKKKKTDRGEVRSANKFLTFYTIYKQIHSKFCICY